MVKPSHFAGYSDAYTRDCERVLVTLLHGLSPWQERATCPLVPGSAVLTQSTRLNQFGRSVEICYIEQPISASLLRKLLMALTIRKWRDYCLGESRDAPLQCANSSARTVPDGC